MNTEHLYLVCIYILVYTGHDLVCLHFLFVCAQHLSGPGRLERNSQSSCQGSQMGCELLIQKIASVLERPSFQTLLSLTSACVLSVMCQVLTGALWEGTRGKLGVKIYRTVMRAP